MKKTKLGRTNLMVTQLGFGAMEIRGSKRGGRDVTERQAEIILNSVLDAGINFVDTSPDYGFSEDLIGKFISQRRDEYYLATKCGCHSVDKGDKIESVHIWEGRHIEKNIESSLKRMKVDYVDIWQLHNPPFEDFEKGKLLETMQKVKDAGKVRFISISSTHPHIGKYIELRVFDTFQIPYSALQREHEEAITLAAKSGAGTIIRGGVAKGDPDRSGVPLQNRWEKWDQAGLSALLQPGQNKTDFMLRFTISHPYMHTTIVGTLNPQHLEENLKAVETGPLPPDIYSEAKAKLDAAAE
jgi:aryl-alcohol dehydrogenase-like predicted oxidoreductase